MKNEARVGRGAFKILMELLMGISDSERDHCCIM